LLEVMRDLNQNHGMTFVFSTHDEKIMERATRLVHLHDGKIELDEHK
jgi:putative ABC transport system ATP-binding protein